jgi:hypothetical protein
VIIFRVPKCLSWSCLRSCWRTSSAARINTLIDVRFQAFRADAHIAMSQSPRRQYVCSIAFTIRPHQAAAEPVGRWHGARKAFFRSLRSIAKASSAALAAMNQGQRRNTYRELINARTDFCRRQMRTRCHEHRDFRKLVGWGRGSRCPPCRHIRKAPPIKSLQIPTLRFSRSRNRRAPDDELKGSQRRHRLFACENAARRSWPCNCSDASIRIAKCAAKHR